MSRYAEQKDEIRILVVDDEPYVREILRRWLEDDGYACDEVGDAQQAMDALDRDPYELVVADVRMPGMSGIELLIRIHEKHPETAVVMATAVDHRQTAIRTLEMGAFGYIIKPFDEDEVLIGVANALERRRLHLLARDYQQRLETEVRERTSELQAREEEISLRLVAAAEFRDEETGAHVRRLGLYAEALAGDRGWSRRRAEEIRLAAPMHDVGKLGIPDSILMKPGKLDAGEFEVMKTHTTIGSEILGGSSVPLLQLAEEIATTHHEKWDGSGYPAGLAGEAIPESGRIVAVVDVYDALVHDRVYRPAVPEEEALEIMRAKRGSHFDSNIFDLFLASLPRLREIRRRVAEEYGGDPDLS